MNLKERKKEFKESIDKIKSDGYDLKFSYKNGLQVATATNNGLEFKRTGSEIYQCVKSLMFDIYGKLK